MQMRRSFIPAISMLFIVLVMGSSCATKHAFAPDPRDKIEGLNRATFQVNESFDDSLLSPLAKTYRAILPSVIRDRVSGIYANLDNVGNSVNHALQGDMQSAGKDILRLLINSTLGILGMFDVASSFGLHQSEQDFGRTLATWGIDEGSYFVIPLFGVSTLRDAPAMIIDYFLNPLAYLDSSKWRFTLFFVRTINTRQQFLQQEDFIRSMSPDFYAGLRNYYLTRRSQLVNQESTEDIAEDAYEDL